jgi:hypothetical protein
MTKQDCEMEWMRLRYPEGMGSAKFGLLPPDHNFVRAYHLTSAKHAESNITRRRLKVARFSEVNDPFELMALNFHKRETRQLVTRFKDLYNSNTGLLCFSKNWTNPLLWSHYADRHKGICLGFDLSRGDVQEVSYVEKRLRMQDEDPHSIPQDLKDFLLRTKFKGWEYEQELRMFVDLSKAEQEQEKGKVLYFWPLGEDLRLREVILGEQNDSLEDIRKLTKDTNPDAVVFKTRLERRGFRIVGDGDHGPEISSGVALSEVVAHANIFLSLLTVHSQRGWQS